MRQLFQASTSSNTSMFGISLTWTMLLTVYAATHDGSVSLVRRAPGENSIDVARNQVEVLPDGKLLSGGSVLSVQQNISLALQKRAQVEQYQDYNEVLELDQCASEYAVINQQFKERMLKGFTPAQISAVLKSSVSAIQTVVQFFVSKNFSMAVIEEGCMKLNTNIFEILFSVLPDMHDKLTDIKSNWDTSFKDFFAKSKDVEANIIEYSKTGKSTTLGKAIKAIFLFAVDTVAKYIPDASKLIDGIETLIVGIIDSWLSIADGDPVGGVQAIWTGATRSIDALIPGLGDNEAYKTIVGGLDPIMGNLNNIVADYTHRIESSKICYNIAITPKSKNPSVCPAEYKMNGLHCSPPAGYGADCWNECGKRAGPCDEFCGRGKVCCKKDFENSCECLRSSGYVVNAGQKGSAYQYFQCVTPGSYTAKNARRARNCAKRKSWLVFCKMSTSNRQCRSKGRLLVDTTVSRKQKQQFGTVKATCETSGKFTWSCKELCYEPCPSDMQPAATNCKCKTPCKAPFSNTASLTPNMCAQEPGLLESWFMETMTGALMTALDLFSSVSKAINKTGDAEKFTSEDLTNTVNSVVEFGKQFAHGKCPFAPL